MVDGMDAYCERHSSIADAFYYMVVVRCLDDASSQISDLITRITCDLESIKSNAEDDS